MSECPLCKTQHPAHSALRLYQSENECSICLEKCADMCALPCGHQFCEKDLKKLGFRRRRTPIPRHRPAPLSDIMRHISRRRQTHTRTIRRRIPVSRRRRCGWCGHMGHTLRKCAAHQRQCGCKTYQGPKHKRLYRKKSTCNVCSKKGHTYKTCSLIMRGRP